MSDFDDNRRLLAEALRRGHENSQAFLSKLDTEDNPLLVRETLATGRYSKRRAALAEEWLRRKEDARASAVAARSEAREEESLSIATAQVRWAMWAAIIATIAAIIATKDQIVALVISWLH